MIKVDDRLSVAASVRQEFIVINKFMGVLEKELKEMKIGEKYLIKAALV